MSWPSFVAARAGVWIETDNKQNQAVIFTPMLGIGMVKDHVQREGFTSEI